MRNWIASSLNERSPVRAKIFWWRKRLGRVAGLTDAPQEE
jgi:hypothetical protein